MLHKLMTMALFMMMSLTMPLITRAGQGTVVLKVWDQWGFFGQTAGAPAIEIIHNEYQRTHPNVVLERSVFGGGWPIRRALEKAFKAGNAPDVFYSWPSGAGIASFVNAGKIADLTSYADAHKWWARLPEWAQLRNMNRGRLYAYPWEVDLEYVYYNRALFKKLGIGVPETYKDVLNWCQVAKKAGYIPIALGNKDLWPAVNMFSDMTALTGGRQLGLDILQNRKKWNNPEVRDALTKILEMVSHGCFSPKCNDVTYEDAMLDFYSEKATAVWTGTWMIQPVIDNMESEKLDIFYFPKIYPDKPQASHISEGSAYYIASQSKIKDVAAEYIDFITHPRWLKTWIEEGYAIPAQKQRIDFSHYRVEPVVAKAFQIGLDWDDRHVDAFHTTAPLRVTDVLYHKLPDVLLRKLSIADFLNEIDQKMAIAASTNETWSP
jgi:ABC-type glycerol-3-phosphate transport system substrate-binding protein